MDKELRWSAPEFEYHHKSSSWYLWVIAAAAVLIILALLQGNFLFIVFTLIAVILIIRWGAQTPRYLDFTLTDNSLVIDNKKIYPYEQLAGFAVKRIDNLEDGLSNLIFRRQHRLSTYIKVLFPSKRTEEIRHFLNRHLPEIEYEDSLTDHLSKLLRF